MRNFLKIAEGADVIPLLGALNNHPELWNQNDWRSTCPGTPHGDTDDIWLRFWPEESVKSGELEPAINQTECEWYPASDALWPAKVLVLDALRRVNGYELGHVIITRLSPGEKILPHSDIQGDYVKRGGRRYHIVLQGLPGSRFRCGEESVCMQTGEVWTFDHTQEHEVINNSRDDRIHLIADIRSC